MKHEILTFINWVEIASIAAAYLQGGFSNFQEKFFDLGF